MNIKASSNDIFLRAIEPEDENFLYSIENREESFLVGENRIPFSHDYLQRFIYASLQDNFFSSGQLRLVACRVEQGKNDTGTENILGIIDYFNYKAFHRRAEVGIVVCSAYRGQGWGEKILELACRYAKNCLNLHQLYAEVGQDNTPSLALFEKAGFVRCALRKDWILRGEVWTDVSGWQKIL